MAIGDVHLRRDCCDDEPPAGVPLDFYEEGSTDDSFLFHEGANVGSDDVPAVVPYDSVITTVTFSNLLGQGVTGQTYEVFVNAVSVASFPVNADTQVTPLNVPVTAGDQVGVFAGDRTSGVRAKHPHVTLYLT